MNIDEALIVFKSIVTKAAGDLSSEVRAALMADGTGVVVVALRGDALLPEVEIAAIAPKRQVPADTPVGTTGFVKLVTVSNGEAGDSSTCCALCGDSLADPHSLVECATGLRNENVRLHDLAAQFEAENEKLKADRDQALAELAALSLAAMDADLHCWGPAFTTPETAHPYAVRLRQLAQPNRDRSNTAWRLLDAWRAEVPALRRENEKLKAEREQLEVQLAGCATAAEVWSPPGEEAKPGDYGYSASYGAVLKLRREVEKLRRELPADILGLPGWSIWAHESEDPTDPKAVGWPVSWEFRYTDPATREPTYLKATGATDSEALDQVRQKLGLPVPPVPVQVKR